MVTSKSSYYANFKIIMLTFNSLNANFERKSIFAINLPLKLFPATVANADIGSLSLSIHLIF